MTQLVIVESPAKAETIHKYLGSDYTVLASYGHIRDLAAKNGSVLPEEDFAMVWSMEDRSKKHVDAIAKALKSCDSLILATDPDREGEAISWHVREELQSRKLLTGKKVSRVVFNEITKSAIQEAMKHPREIDAPLVNAYLARRSLDYLVGFTLSPVLWRKLPGSRSAGRVQSVALRLICEREAEIEAFIPQEYWSVEALLKTPQGQGFTARLVEWQGKKIVRLDISSGEQAHAAADDIRKAALGVTHIEHKSVQRNPYPPFITSTLQQESSKKLGFSTTRTMQIAQKLYEGIQLGGETTGLITYMRTDGVTLSQEAVMGIRDFIGQKFGAQWLPPSPRMYKSKSKNAQEAHEAIRPTDIRRTPESVRGYLNDEQFRLYDLIWKRTVACQMANAVMDQVRVDIAPADRAVVLRATGQVVTFEGFLSVYRAGKDEDGPSEKPRRDDDTEANDTEDTTRLPKLEQGMPLKQDKVETEQHFTKPPPRYTEASMVKQMEELGIGRPSTYASIIRILVERNYAVLENKRFVPQDRGRLVTTFLTHFFERYVQYNFTAQLEEQLDQISAGELDWKQVMKKFWQDFADAVAQTKDLKISDVIDVLDEDLAQYFFPQETEGHDPRDCPSCKTEARDGGRLGLKLGRFGAFIGCAHYPTCKYTRQLKLSEDGSDDGDMATAAGPVTLGNDPETNKPVYLCKGPYGHYVQLGDVEEAPETAPEAATQAPEKKGAKGKKPAKSKAPKPKRTSLPSGLAPSQVDLAKALSLLTLPRELGTHPETSESISASLGRFGPYVKMGSTFVSLKGEDDVLTVDLARAVEIIETSGKKAIPVGDHDGKPVTIHKGRFGHYIKWKTLQFSIPKGTDPNSVSLEQAGVWIDAKVAQGSLERTKKATGGKTAKASAAKKTATSAKPKRATSAKSTKPKRTVKGKVTRAKAGA